MQESIVSRAIESFRKREGKQFLTAFLAVFIIGFIAHGYCFANLTISHDSINEISIFSELYFNDGTVFQYNSSAWQWKISLGRFVEPIYDIIVRGVFASPWLAGILSLFWISMSVWLICKIFSIRKIYEVVLIAGMLTVNDTYTSLAATYLTDVDAVMFAGWMAVCMVYCWRKGGKYIYLGIPCLVLALGIYQCMVSVSIALIIMLSVMDLLRGSKAKKVLLNGLKSIGIIAIAGILYLVLVKLACAVAHVELCPGYNGLTNLFSYDKSIKNIWTLICTTYQQVFDSYINISTWMYYVTDEPYYVLYGICGIILAYFCFVYIRAMCSKEISVLNKALITLLICVLPFGMNIASFADGGMSHTLMMYSLWLIYIIIIKFDEWNISIRKIHKNRIHWNCVIYIILAAILWNNIQAANTIYVKKDLDRQVALSIMTEVNADMHEEGYVDGETKVHFVGSPQMGMNEMSYVSGIIGPSSKSQIPYQSTYVNYYKYILQRPINLVVYDDDEKYDDMPSYPEKGYIQWYDDMMVVKFLSCSEDDEVEWYDDMMVVKLSD